MINNHLKVQISATHLLFQTVQQIFKRGVRWNETLHAIIQNGVGSIPIITFATAFAGLVISKEIAWHMDKALNTVAMIPGVTGQFIIREVGIAVPALLLASKVGAATTAEIGTMKITDQLDALRILKIDPIHYLVAPRFIASIISTICLTLLSLFVTMLCALWVAIISYNFSFLEYANSVQHFVSPKDLVCAITKAAIFGAIIPISSSSYGFHCKKGAEGVGTATTDSVVATTILIITWDFVLTYLFSLIR